MNKVLICDSYHFEKKIIDWYDKIFYLDDGASVRVCDNIKIEEIKLYKFFMTAHKKTRELNKILLKRFSLNNSIHASLLKMMDEELYYTVRILEVVESIRKRNMDAEISILVRNNIYILPVSDILKIDIGNIKIISVKKDKFSIKKILSVFRVFLLVVIGFFVKKKYQRNIFFLHNDKVSFSFAKPYLDNNTITYPFFSFSLKCRSMHYDEKEYISSKFIVLSELFMGYKRFKANKKNIVKLDMDSNLVKLYLDRLCELEIVSMMVLSLKHKFVNLKNIIGTFDTYSPIDYVTFLLNKMQNITTICIPHGINYKYKVNYISYGTNIYTLWSRDHYDRMEFSNILDGHKVKKVITGNVVYSNTLKYKMEKIYEKKILIIGEYFSTDSYYSSPFNTEISKRLLSLVSKFVETHNCLLTIRTRLNDSYCKIANEYSSDRVKITSSDTSIIEDINDNDLVISIFSNALHEALLLGKIVLQVNFLEIENYRSLAEDKLVYYASTEDELNKILVLWYDGLLEYTDYNLHLEKYANSGNFFRIEL
ncbi:hypothetical protein [Campylobacter mucosalis]|uniref:hypothetical protein n=1 Tax=Campylobacter mucosalis TaxID=202 RepID=UPI0014707ECE|nr:hypothetical protein [Campylobacter mucosalis]